LIFLKFLLTLSRRLALSHQLLPRFHYYLQFRLYLRLQLIQLHLLAPYSPQRPQLRLHLLLQLHQESHLRNLKIRLVL
jgi:hypothetical protein